MSFCNDFLLIGKIVGVHGLKGTLKISSYAEDNVIFSPGESIYTVKGKNAFQKHTITKFSTHKRRLRLTLKGVDDADGAETFVGQDIYIPKHGLAETEEDEYYWSDLIGMSVYSSEDEYLGVLKAVLPTGGNDVYVVDDNVDEILVPALGHVILNVDVHNKTMRVKLPEGL